MLSYFGHIMKRQASLGKDAAAEEKQKAAVPKEDQI